MEKYLSSIQVLEFCDICNAYLRGEYNTLIQSIRLNGYVIRNLSDKKKINDIMSSIVANHELSMWQAIELAVEKKLIKLSDRIICYLFCFTFVRYSSYLLQISIHFLG